MTAPVERWISEFAGPAVRSAFIADTSSPHACVFREASSSFVHTLSGPMGPVHSYIFPARSPLPDHPCFGSAMPHVANFRFSRAERCFRCYLLPEPRRTAPTLGLRHTIHGSRRSCAHPVDTSPTFPMPGALSVPIPDRSAQNVCSVRRASHVATVEGWLQAPRRRKLLSRRYQHQCLRSLHGCSSPCGVSVLLCGGTAVASVAHKPWSDRRS